MPWRDQDRVMNLIERLARQRVRPTPEVDALLRDRAVAWLSTTSADDVPAIVPVWFVWDGETFLVFSKPHARKVRNLTANPRVMLAVGDPADDFDVQLVEGRAELLAAPTIELLPPALGAKYRAWLDGIGLGLDEFAATYGQPIRISPTRFLPWRGRTWLGQGRRVADGPLVGRAPLVASPAI
jgi:PPOX class probable F420-dependent enzyme